MKAHRILSVLVTTSVFALVPQSAAAQDPIADQIWQSVAPLRAVDRDAATVLGYREGSANLEVIREGTNQYICLADSPGDENFRVVCYHESLDPFMGRGREIRAAGGSGADVRRIRLQEVESGELTMPAQAMFLILSGTRGPDGAAPDSVSSRSVIYVPYATPESIGLSGTPQGTEPWLMDPGQHRAHVMLSGPRKALRD